MSAILNEAQALEHCMHLLNLRTNGAPRTASRSRSPRRASDTRLLDVKRAARAPVQPQRVKTVGSSLNLGTISFLNDDCGTTKSKPGLDELMPPFLNRGVTVPANWKPAKKERRKRRGSEKMPLKPRRVGSGTSLLSLSDISLSICEDEEMDFFEACDKYEMNETSELTLYDSESENDDHESDDDFDDSSTLDSNSVLGEHDAKTPRTPDWINLKQSKVASPSPSPPPPPPRDGNSPKDDRDAKTPRTSNLKCINLKQSRAVSRSPTRNDNSPKKPKRVITKLCLRQS